MVRGPRLFDRPTRRDHEVNWGDKTKITGNERKTLAWVSVAVSQAMTVYATAIARGSGSAGVACVVNVEWGHGGASIDHDYPIVHRLRVPVVGSMVKIAGRLLDTAGAPPPASVSAEVAVVIAPGVDGETVRNTDWVYSGGADGVLSSGPARVVRLEGYNAGAVDTWVMFCDGAAQDGDVPIIARPARMNTTFEVQRFDSQAFRTSLNWYASSTPFLLTRDPRARLRVDAEILL
jgi:hypothetical protein